MINFLSGAAGTLVATVLTALFCWFLVVLVRRLLGIRVGWFRAVVVALVIGGSTAPFLQWLLQSGWLGAPSASAPGMMLLALVVVLWAFALGSLVLVVAEVAVPSGSLPPARRLVTGWRSRWRRWRRYAQVLAIASRHGLGTQLRGLGGNRGSAPERTARALARALDDAGVTFVKLGQMLSTRADLLPEAYVSELSRLQVRAQPEPWSAIEAMLDTELGRPWQQVFTEIDPEPLASASVAQVHAARLPDGSQVVVKVQRPTALRSVQVDSQILLRLARTLDRNARWARRLGVRGLVAGFTDSLAEELDYRVEMDNLAALAESSARHGVRLPELHAAPSTARLLVLERFDGQPLSRRDGLDELPEDHRRAAAQTLLTTVFEQVLVAGVFHADLHPGNVFWWPDGSVGLLDFGSVGRLDAATRRNLGLLLWAVDNDDPVFATDTLLEMLDRPADLDERALQRGIGQLIVRARTSRGRPADLFPDLLGLVMRHGLQVPPQLAAALRCLGALEGTLRLLDPDLDLLAVARESGRGLLAEPSPQRLKEELTDRGVRLLPLLDQLPRRISKVTEDLERGRTTINLRLLADPDDRRFLTGLVQQLVVAVLAAAAVLGGILLITSGTGPQLLPGFGWLDLLGYLLAFAGFVLALRSVAQVYARRE